MLSIKNPAAELLPGSQSHFFCFSKPIVFPDLTAEQFLFSLLAMGDTHCYFVNFSLPAIYHCPSLRQKHLHGLAKEVSLGEMLS